MADDPKDDGWKRAKEGWDALRRAAGAIPPLPPRISNATLPDSLPIVGPAQNKPDDLEGGLQAMQDLARGREEAAKGIAESIEPLADAAAQSAFNREVRRYIESELGSSPPPSSSKLDAETVLSRDDLSQYGYRNLQPNSERSADKTTVAKPNDNNGKFSAGDLVVLISCALFAEPFCHAGAAEFLAEHYDKAALGFFIGIPPGIAGGTFHWWKRWIGKAAQRAAIPVAIAMGLVGAVLAFGYIAGPEIYQRATAPKTQNTTGGFGFAEAQMSQPKHPSKNYSSEEKQRLLGLIGNISTLLNNEGLPAAQLARVTGYNAVSPSKNGLDDAIKRAESVRDSLAKIQIKIWQDILQPKNSNYLVDLNYIVDGNVKLDQFQRATEQFLGSVINFERNLDSFSPDQRNWITGLIQAGIGQNWGRTAEEFRSWVEQCNTRMDAERDGLK